MSGDLAARNLPDSSVDNIIQFPHTARTVEASTISKETKTRIQQLLIFAALVYAEDDKKRREREQQIFNQELDTVITAYAPQLETRKRTIDLLAQQRHHAKETLALRFYNAQDKFYRSMEALGLSQEVIAAIEMERDAFLAQIQTIEKEYVQTSNDIFKQEEELRKFPTDNPFYR